MPKQSLSLTGIVLRIESSGENFRSLFILSPEVGSVRGMQRISTRKNATLNIDLFDEGSFNLQTDSDPHSGFVSDFELAQRRTHLAKSYKAFQAASEFARILSLNATHTENQESVYRLAKRGLDAWESGVAPQATLFKCLYLYCRDEGYPINEEWIARLPAESRSNAVRLINSPLSDLDEQATYPDSMLPEILAYFRNYTHIRV